MDFIPTFHFISAIIIFGLLMYMFGPIITYLDEMFPTASSYATAMFFIWSILAAINLFGSGIRLVMKMQEKKGWGY